MQSTSGGRTLPDSSGEGVYLSGRPIIRIHRYFARDSAALISTGMGGSMYSKGECVMRRSMIWRMTVSAWLPKKEVFEEWRSTLEKAFGPHITGSKTWQLFAIFKKVRKPSMLHELVIFGISGVGWLYVNQVMPRILFWVLQWQSVVTLGFLKQPLGAWETILKSSSSPLLR